MLLRTSVVIAGALAIVAASAQAQVCTGSASFSAGSLRIGGNAEWGNDTRMIGGGLAFGSREWFGGVGVGGMTYDDFDGTTLVINGSGGYQMMLGKTSAVGLCPVASFALGIGPDDIEGSGTDLSARAATAGLQIGTAVQGAEGFQVVPSAGLAFAWAEVELEGGFFGDFEESETFGIASLALGLVFNEIFTVQPRVGFPFAIEDADPSYGVAIGVQFGRRAP